ncbi:GNAT family N-acetyltransferase [Pedobacter yulinensis]|uniref:GNAT family N-acetyltransferase n=1 Tax=Pedobacter yulinensis TaxID=2126353 RepID=A0A2T3HNA8_9SPHI|nr:GNAT family N-acetyltransferase [Pedobacter yulinensis]PST83940.1 GNAT family N-acetyltransferase [Pedobacter yulinensis]
MTQIFQATAHHHDEVLAIWESAVRATHHFLSETDIIFYRESLRSALPEMEVYCLADADGITGFVCAEEQMVHALFVRPEKAGQGVGTALMQFAIEEKKIFRVDVNEQNEAAFRFYKRLGFKVFARRELDGAGKPYPLLMLELPQPGSA